MMLPHNQKCVICAVLLALSLGFSSLAVADEPVANELRWKLSEDFCGQVNRTNPNVDRDGEPTWHFLRTTGINGPVETRQWLRETEATRKLYGLDNPATVGYGTRCLMARRLVESGVRFVQIFPPLSPSFQPWDNHGDLKNGLKTICGHVDQPSAALITDLKQRGLLDDVIVQWTGELGRLPITEGSDGRDHNRHAFSLLMAGGGFKAGHIHGATDEFGYKSVENRVSVPDLHATILNQLGLDHTRLNFAHNGRPERLTDPEVTGARVVKELLS